jgi:DNA-binding NarL/FixJ family response regulator
VDLKRLLLFEANAVFRESLALVLERNMGLCSIHVDSVAEASRALADPHGKVDLAILDVDLMPNGDAVGVIEELRKADPDVPMLVLTNSRNLEGRAPALRAAGVDELVCLRALLEELVGAVRRLMGG